MNDSISRRDVFRGELSFYGLTALLNRTVVCAIYCYP